MTTLKENRNWKASKRQRFNGWHVNSDAKKKAKL
jgi:hypothetical protein